MQINVWRCCHVELLHVNHCCATPGTPPILVSASGSKILHFGCTVQWNLHRNQRCSRNSILAAAATAVNKTDCNPTSTIEHRSPQSLPPNTSVTIINSVNSSLLLLRHAYAFVQARTLQPFQLVRINGWNVSFGQCPFFAFNAQPPIFSVLFRAVTTTQWMPKGQW